MGNMFHCHFIYPHSLFYYSWAIVFLVRMMCVVGSLLPEFHFRAATCLEEMLGGQDVKLAGINDFPAPSKLAIENCPLLRTIFLLNLSKRGLSQGYKRLLQKLF